MSAVANWIEHPPLTAERRRHGRVKVCLPGRFMRASREDFACMTIDISPGGVAFAAEEAVEVGERIIAYIEQLGRLEGVVAREFGEGFAISMKLPAQKRERLAEQLTWLANRQALGLPEDRRHERIRPRLVRTTLILPRGREVLASLVDVSQSGASLTLSRPVDSTVGTPVTVGATPARIVRVHNNGVAVEFTRIIPIEDFNADVVL